MCVVRDPLVDGSCSFDIASKFNVVNVGLEDLSCCAFKLAFNFKFVFKEDLVGKFQLTLCVFALEKQKNIKLMQSVRLQNLFES